MKKSMKVVLSILMVFAIMVTTIISLKVIPIIKKGYEMYIEVLAETTVEEAVCKIRDDENFIYLNDIPKDYINQVVKSEDKRFFKHPGIDLIATARAMYNNIKARGFVQGGSTITQQLAKNMFFSFTKSYERKIAELLMAFKLENILSKNQILELYCNITYMGEDCYGVKEAAEHYYDETPKQLSFEQIKILVFSFRNPSKYNPNALNAVAS